MVEVLRLAIFSKNAKGLFTDADIEDLSAFLVANPEKGDVIPGTGGLRKLRWTLKSKSKGKRGGSRVIYYYHKPRMLIILFTVYAKNQKENLSSDEKKMLKSALERVLS